MTKDEIWQTLKVAFPQGEYVANLVAVDWEDTITPVTFSGKKPTDGFFVAGAHCFALRVIATGHLVLDWVPNRSAGFLDDHPRDANITGMPVFESSDHLTCPEDLLGWISYIKEQIEDQTVNTISKALHPKDLFPGGPASILSLKMAFATLTACGWQEKDILERLMLELNHAIPWKTTPDRTRYLFKVFGAGEGHVVGRVSDGAAGTKLLEYSLRVPCSVQESRESGTTTFHSGTDIEASSRTVLLANYLKITLGFVLKVVETNGHPDGTVMWDRKKERHIPTGPPLAQPGFGQPLLQAAAKGLPIGSPVIRALAVGDTHVGVLIDPSTSKP
jgi:hypothetical protein